MTYDFNAIRELLKDPRADDLKRYLYDQREIYRTYDSIVWSLNPFKWWGIITEVWINLKVYQALIKITGFVEQVEAPTAIKKADPRDSYN